MPKDSLENFFIKRIEKLKQSLVEIEEKVFGKEAQRGSFTKRVEGIEKKTGLKTLDKEANIFKRTLYLYSKIVREEDRNEYDPNDHPF